MIPNPLNLPDEGEHLQALGFEILLERRRVAELVLPTGQLVACDPLSQPETEPFAREVPIGTFPVYAIVAKMRDEVRTAYVVVEFSDQRPQNWEIAYVRGEEPPRWNRERHGFHVESTIAALMDDQTADRLLDVMYFGEDDDELERAVRREFRKNRRSGAQVSHADVMVDARSGGNLVAFDADSGTYVTYFGSDADDNVAMAVLDFEVLDYRFTPYGLHY